MEIKQPSVTVLMSRHFIRNARIANRYFEIVAELYYLGTTVTNCRDIKGA